MYSARIHRGVVAGLVSLGFCFAQASIAMAADKRALVIETKKKGFKELGRGLRVTLKQNHNYDTIKESDFLREAKKRGLGTGAKPSQMVEVGMALGADVVVLAFAEPQKGQWNIVVKAEATDGRGAIFNQTFFAAKPKLERTQATEIARAIRAADASGQKAAGGGDDMSFSLDDAAAPPASEPTAMSFDLTNPTEAAELPAMKVAPKQLTAGEASAANEADAAAETDDEFYEPTDELTDNEEPPRYVAPDGRSGFVGTVGLSMLARNTGASGANGTPPRYLGIVSPGVAINLSLFPRRFKEGGGIARDFGAFARAHITFMPSQFVQLGVAQNFTDTMLNLQVGAAFRHVFGNQEKSVAFGAQVGVVFDQVTMDRSVPFPTTFYLSPLLAAELEVPLFRKLAVLTARAGVLPISGLSRQAVESFGIYKWAFGVTGAIGVHSTIWNDLVYVDVTGHVTNYWQEFTGTGTSRFTNVAVRDTVFGFSASVGVAY
jgi:hypothetical protein